MSDPQDGGKSRRPVQQQPAKAPSREREQQPPAHTGGDADLSQGQGAQGTEQGQD